jgi:hypothetical protein
MDRFDILTAYAFYAMLWAPTGYDVRLRKLGFRLGCGARLETAEAGAKEAYGRLVRRHGALLVGFERLYRRHPEVAGSWPGTYNIPGGDVRRYLASRGILEACEALCPS